MGRPTGVKTRDIRKALRKAGFEIVRNEGAHEIHRNGPDWTRVAAGHEEMDANELRNARRAMEAAARRRAEEPPEAA
jgi:predicted RNA binding protein YcfA (HicA-like mRNA interferase family)